MTKFAALALFFALPLTQCDDLDHGPDPCTAEDLASHAPACGTVVK